jgi:hypothetical protein
MFRVEQKFAAVGDSNCLQNKKVCDLRLAKGLIDP